jgi:transglutaminase-like putative cysteine protease/predicted glutamine amidotransferase
MTHVLGFSFDCEVSPSIIIKPYKLDPSQKEFVYGWGYGWYPGNEDAATIIKDATAARDSHIIKAMAEWQRFYSTLFICHIRGAAKNIVQKNIQPFSRSFAGSDWIMLHNGDLENYDKAFPLGNDPLFEPIGTTDSEYIFCWLMQKISQEKIRGLGELDKQQLHQWFLNFNDYGTGNFMLSDGKYLVVYHDKKAFNQLYWCRRTPPYEQTVMESSDVIIDLSGDIANKATMMVFANEPLTNEKWEPMKPGEMLVVRRGWITWDSEDESLAHKSILTGETDVQKITATRKSKAKPYTYRIIHETNYHYDKPVLLSRHQLRMKPRHYLYQELISHKIAMKPNVTLTEYEDVFGNFVYYTTIKKPYTHLSIRTESLVKVYPHLYNSLPDERNQNIPLIWMPWQRQMMMPFLLPMELPESNLRSLSDYAMSFVKRSDYNLLSVLHDINQSIYHDYKYIPGITSLATTPFDVYEKRSGVCQDFANLFICLAQLLNIPARYRTGYIYTGADYENTMQSDASHAWIEVYLPKLGWLGYDPTNGILAATDHVQVACGRNYRDATPTGGTIFEGGGEEEMTISVKVERM